MLKERTVDTMDGLLSLFERNDTLLESSRRLFDKLFDTRNTFDFFA
jgi:hypothetical protein